MNEEKNQTEPILKSKIGLIIALILSLPILLHVYNPSMHLGAFGIMLGIMGMTISPLILFGIIFYLIYQSWK